MRMKDEYQDLILSLSKGEVLTGLRAADAAR